jgi:hypothetical protein
VLTGGTELKLFDEYVNRIIASTFSTKKIDDALLLCEKYLVADPPVHPYRSYNLALLLLRFIKTKTTKELSHFYTYQLRTIDIVCRVFPLLKCDATHERLDYLSMGAVVGLSLPRDISSCRSLRGYSLCEEAIKVAELLAGPFESEATNISWSPYDRILVKLFELKASYSNDGIT